MKKTTIKIVLALLCLNFRLTAQTLTPDAGLKSGDPLPDVRISNILNYSTSSLQTRTLQGKVVILDFWATWCSACLLNFPKMEALQTKFGENIQVLGVAYESTEKISKFFQSVNGRRYHPATATADTQLTRLFPHRGLPHYIIIDKNGIVRAITGADEVNEKLIKDILTNAPLQVQTKKDLDPNRPLFLDEAYPSDNTVLKYSILSKGYYSGLGSGNHPRKNGGKTIGLAVTNSTLLWMYKAAALPQFNSQQVQFSGKRVLMNVADPSAITLNARASNDGLYDNSNVYNYDLILPEAQADKLYETMLSDLNALTPYYGSVEKRTVTCLVLKRTDTIDRIRTKGGQSRNSLFSDPPYELRNRPIRQLVTRLNDEDWIPHPVVNETDYAANVDLSISVSTDLASLRNSLRKYGLDLIKEERPLLMLVISDKKSQSK